MSSAASDRHWHISVIVDRSIPRSILVPTDCCTAILHEKIREQSWFAKDVTYQLNNSNGKEISDKTTERLSDFDLKHGSTISVVVRLEGGVFPTVEDLEKRVRVLEPGKGFEITTSADHPDVLGLDDDKCQRALMSCGHAIAPLTMAQYCHLELENGKYEIFCPGPDCKSKLTFGLIQDVACLSLEEFQEFERKAHHNRFNKNSDTMKPCPECSRFSAPLCPEDKRLVCEKCSENLGRQFEFCWKCLREWKNLEDNSCGNENCEDRSNLFQILANCPDKEIVRGLMSPSKRACPTCFTIIEHTENCKHMTCKMCSHEFCFVCLKEWPCRTYTFDACDVAPRQVADANDLPSKRQCLECQILENCPEKEIINGVLSPSMRACPNCFAILEHIENCKHMTCRMCSHEFCFICLEKWPCKTDTFAACEVAPRQVVDAEVLQSEVSCCIL